MSWDYSKLRGRIIEKYGSMTKFAEAVGLSKSALSRKLNNFSSFNQEDIELFRGALEIEQSDIGTYFFTVEVQ